MGFGKAIPLKEIILPIGISFYTFQGITYIVDLFRGEVEVQKNPLKIALYISLFPQLVAGPIIRYKDIARQIDDRSLNVDLFYSGAVRFIFGLGKKVIIANNVAAIADAVFSSPADTHSISTAWLGAICFALQLYFDFSGYSDMAIGLGKMFGFEFRENFNYPYISRNIREFWRRWHISLSSFFRDYLYIPLGGNRRGNVYFNLIIVFAATGLWHGAGWTYIVWGLWHGLFIIIENVIKRTPTLARIAEKATAPIFRIFTHIYALLVILIGWVIFRSESISYAAAFLKNMFSFSPSGNIRVSTLYYLDSFHALVLGAAIMLSLPLYPKLAEWIRTKNHNMGMFSVLHIICLGILLVVSMLMIINQGYNPFLYFRF
ncbi:MAG: MBOAT family protein [Clostridiales Family XIII bacterium]|nr:MBOAT family protein [Clostridiales Family XIII bacterium]